SGEAGDHQGQQKCGDGHRRRVNTSVEAEEAIPMNKPDHYNELARRYPAFIQALSRLGETVQSLGPLDARTCHLIQLAAAAARGSEGAVHSHARRALEAGASADDVNHTLLCLTSTIGFPAVSA